MAVTLATTTTTLPDTCDVAFKEWAGVCRAIADGRQSILLRKGGIAEGPGPGEFVPEHETFWLYPTHLHEAQQGLRDEPPAPATGGSDPGIVEIRTLARVVSIGFVERPEVLPALADLHVWTEETVLRRFHYRRPGLWVLGVRAYRRPEPRPVRVTPDQAGCKTWVTLEAPMDTVGLTPALDEAAFARRLEALRNVLGRS